MEQLKKDLIEKTTELLQQKHRQTGDLWLLIDPILRPAVRGTALGKALGTREALPLIAPGGEPDPRVAPFLVKINSGFPREDEALIRQSVIEAQDELAAEQLIQGHGRRICGWLECAGDGTDLAKHLGNALVQQNGPRRMLVRWYDPAVLWLFYHLLEPAQRAALLGPARCFNLLWPAGHPQSYRSPKPGPSSGDLQLTRGQWNKTRGMGAFNLFLQTYPERPTTVAGWDKLQHTALRAMLEAHKLGFHDPEDFKVFAELALTVHPEFYKHPLITQCLVGRKTTDYFTGLIDSLTPEQWVQIQASTPPQSQDQPSS